MKTQHVIFAEYAPYLEIMAIKEFLVDRKLPYALPLVKDSKRMLKENGMKQKGHTTIIVDEETLLMLKLAFTSIKHKELS
jgi:hypothetical protein